MLLPAVDHCNPADLRRLQSFFREGDCILVELDDVDLLAAKLADDGLYAHALHADARPNGIHVLVFRHDGDFRALSRLARDRPNHHGSVVNFRYFRLEQVLHKLGRGAGHHDSRAFGGAFNPSDNDTHSLSHRKGFQPRLFLARHPRLGLADIENHVRAFYALHRGIDDLAHPPDVLVIDGVTLGLSYFLKDDLLRQLRSDASQNAVDRLRDQQLSADCETGIQLLCVFKGNLKIRILNLLGCLHNHLDYIGADLARVLVQPGTEIFLRFVVLARSHDNGIFHRADYNLRINPFFPAECIDRVVELAWHKKAIW